MLRAALKGQRLVAVILLGAVFLVWALFQVPEEGKLSTLRFQFPAGEVVGPRKLAVSISIASLGKRTVAAAARLCFLVVRPPPSIRARRRPPIRSTAAPEVRLDATAPSLRLKHQISSSPRPPPASSARRQLPARSTRFSRSD